MSYFVHFSRHRSSVFLKNGSWMKARAVIGKELYTTFLSYTPRLSLPLVRQASALALNHVLHIRSIALGTRFPAIKSKIREVYFCEKLED